ncbi:hypothetical protein [Sphingopyxis sp.]|uniref:hypothetical protein n=1 Tax=Sphingopyxis sp. TaxID=1908224 RepID=UPI0025E9B919|nr:hypothetical protein [Sphingopyxis sp.]MBK6414281.1 hypothetical protein [Sphingopyxis sp.]
MEKLDHMRLLRDAHGRLATVLITNEATMQEVGGLFRTPAADGVSAPADVYPQFLGIIGGSSGRHV